MSETPPPVSEPAMLQDFLRERDVSCPRCSYNLRNLAGNRCPECGDELALRVNLVEPKLAPFLTGLVGLAACAGFYILLTVFAILKERPGGRIMVVLLGGSGVAVIGLATFLLCRRPIRKLPLAAQWGIAGVCWIITCAGLLVFMGNV